MSPRWKTRAATVAKRLLRLPPDTPTRVDVEGTGPAYDDTRPLRVMTWNIQFGAGRGPHFFYDGGTAVSVRADTVHRTLDAIAAVIRDANPDLVLLQEVDRASRRTAYVDEYRELQRRLTYPCSASATYHRCRYVPHPAHEHLGAVDMHLAIFSRFGLSSAQRVPLPLLREPAWRRAFNLRRCLLEARVLRTRGPHLAVFNTHFSAFARGDGTLERQVQATLHALEAADAASRPWFLAGDLNALPPGDDPSRLHDPEEYPETVSPIAPLFERYGHPSTTLLTADARTYLPPGATDPDRVLDYAFFSEGTRALHYRVIREGTAALSDHLPVLFEVATTGPSVITEN